MGIDRDPLQVEGGYVWFEIAGINLSRERPLDEVKEQVEARWREQEIATRLKTKAAESSTSSRPDRVSPTSPRPTGSRSRP